MNPKYTFDSFVIGSSNRFAHAAALAVAEAPAQAYNPLFIYGKHGARQGPIFSRRSRQYTSEHAGSLTARYVTSETFMNDFINSLRDKRIEGFKQRYRNYDVLLIDDVQFFENKERHPGGVLPYVQLALRSRQPDRHLVGPAAAGDLDARRSGLRSRFEWGLITDIQPPDPRDANRHPRKKEKTRRASPVPDAEVLTFIAGRISTNIRELEVALTPRRAFSSLTGSPMTDRPRTVRA
jgi:chromosomal replication initiator protein